MPGIVELIQQLCPDGVVYKPLGEVFKTRNGYTPSKKNSEYWEPGGTVPWFRMEDIRENGRLLETPLQYVSESAVKRNGLMPKGSLIVATSATIGEHAMLMVDGLCNQRFTCLSVKQEYTELVSEKYVFYWGDVLDEFCKMNLNQGNFASVNMDAFNRCPFPVPPLEVQQEIVRILDAFTELEANLQRELAVRKRQYEHYRDELLSFSSEAKGVRLGDLGEFYGGLSGKTKADFKEGANASFIPYTNVFNNMVVDFGSLTPVEVRPDEKQNAVHKGDVLFTTSSETPDECAMASIVKEEPKGAVYLNSFCRGFRPRTDTGVDIDFLKHLLHSFEMRQKLTRTANGVTRFNVSKKLLLDVVIPIPSLETQKEIVSKLDAMLDLQDNLRRQIELTRRQYEHYRDVLLDLPRKES